MTPREVVVMKFGGTSVGDVGRIKHVAQIILDFKAANPTTALVIVVSAMAGETNKLVALAQSCCQKPDPRELDVLLASGEQVSIALLSIALIAAGQPARSLLAGQARILTDGNHTNAHITGIKEELLLEILNSGAIPIVAGFQGVNAAGDLTTLGRGGSDITAVALAAALNAASCWIYTDVAGVFTSDPRFVPNARLMREVSHDDMLEMASLGAKVLHTRSVYFAKVFKIPILVLSTSAGPQKPGVNGTWIVSEERLMERPVITGVTFRIDEAMVTVEGVASGTEKLALLFEALGAGGVQVDMITQSPASDGRTTVSFCVSDEVSAEALKLVRGLLPQIDSLGASLFRNIAKVSLVGIGMRYHTDVAGRLFRALSKNSVPIDLISATETKISLLVPRKYCEIAARVMHREFLEAGEPISEY